MMSTTEEALPIKLTYFFLSAAGFAIPATRNERILVRVVTMYSIIILTFSCWRNAMDIYHCWGTFHELVHSLVLFCTSILVQVKFAAFMFKKKKYLRLMKYTKEILWTKQHNGYGKYIIEECEKQAMHFIIGFIGFVLCTAISYMVQPFIIFKIGRNEIDRVLPLPLWVDLPIYITPWYEISFFIVVLDIVHMSICYFCFDNFLTVTNIFLTGQFKILRNRLEILFDTHDPLLEFYNEDDKIQTRYSLRRNMIKEAHDEFKRCVEQHKILIDLVKTVEDIYSFVNLAQILILSFLMCFIGYQLILPGNSMARCVLFIAFFGACLLQLFTFSFTCNNLTRASTGIGRGSWTSKWYISTWCREGRALVRDLEMLMMRAQRPCQLTAFGFFPVTIDTFKSILSAAYSYLMLMRSSGDSMQ